MNLIINIPLFSIIALLVSSAVSSLLSAKAARRLTLCLCLILTGLQLVLLGYGIRTGSSTVYMMGHYPHPWGNEIRFGVLEPFIGAVFTLVMFLCILGGRNSLEEDLEPEKGNLYYVMADLVTVSLIALTYTYDLFTGYVFIEICTIASCGLLMIRQTGRTTLASVRYMIFSLIGSGLFLMGVILLYGITGHLLMPNLQEAVAGLCSSGAYPVAFRAALILMCMGLAVKSGLFPFHHWMPDTYGYATPASSGILSGIVSKGYLFFLIKIVFLVFGTDVFYRSGMDLLFFVLGAAGVILGSVSAITCTDVFRMTAFSSAAQIGYIFMGIGISPAAGMIAAVFHIAAHAVTKPAVFLSLSGLCRVSGSRIVSELRGAAKDRLSAFVFAAAAFSMTGVPITVGFLSKYYFAGAALAEKPGKMMTVLITLALSTLLNAVYFGRIILTVYSPSLSSAEVSAQEEKRPGGSYRVSLLIFLFLILAGGFFGGKAAELLRFGFTVL